MSCWPCEWVVGSVSELLAVWVSCWPCEWVVGSVSELLAVWVSCWQCEWVLLLCCVFQLHFVLCAQIMFVMLLFVISTQGVIVVVCLCACRSCMLIKSRSVLVSLVIPMSAKAQSLTLCVLKKCVTWLQSLERQRWQLYFYVVILRSLLLHVLLQNVSCAVYIWQ